MTETAVLEEMKARDLRDRSRETSPLRPAEGAVVLDSTEMSLDEVLARSEEIVRVRLES